MLLNEPIELDIRNSAGGAAKLIAFAATSIRRVMRHIVGSTIT
jgi:hypothetical protein